MWPRRRATDRLPSKEAAADMRFVPDGVLSPGVRLYRRMLAFRPRRTTVGLMSAVLGAAVGSIATLHLVDARVSVADVVSLANPLIDGASPRKALSPSELASPLEASPLEASLLEAAPPAAAVAPEPPRPKGAKRLTDEPGLSGAVARALGVKRTSPARERR
jgi:hypothetical protein